MMVVAWAVLLGFAPYGEVAVVVVLEDLLSGSFSELHCEAWLGECSLE